MPFYIEVGVYEGHSVNFTIFLSESNNIKKQHIFLSNVFNR